MDAANRAKTKSSKDPVSREDFSSILDHWVTGTAFSASIKEAVGPELNQLKDENRLLREAVKKNSDRIAILEQKIENGPSTQNDTNPFKTALMSGSNQAKGGNHQPIPTPVTRGEVVQIMRDEANKNRLSENLFKLRITGLRDLTKDNQKVKVIAMAKSIDIDLFPMDFSTEFIIAKTSDGQNTIKGLMAKFNTIWKKQELYKARVGLKGKDIFLSEQLDKKTQEIFYLCRKLRRDNIVQNAWTFNSVVYVKLNDKTIKVADRSCYQQIVDGLYHEEENDITPALSELDISSHHLSQSDLNRGIRVAPNGPKATSSPIGKSGSRAPGVPETEISRLPGLSVSDPDLTSYSPSDISINRAEALLRSKEEKLERLYNIKQGITFRNKNLNSSR